MSSGATAVRKSWFGALLLELRSSVTTDRCFYTDDVVIPSEALQDQPAGAEDPGGDLPYLPERDVNPAQPLFQDGVPKRRLGQKRQPPAISQLSMLHIEGENRIVKKNPESFEFPIIPRSPEDQDQNASPVSSGDSWTLETEQSLRQVPLPDDDEDGGEG